MLVKLQIKELADYSARGLCTSFWIEAQQHISQSESPGIHISLRPLRRLEMATALFRRQMEEPAMGQQMWICEANRLYVDQEDYVVFSLRGYLLAFVENVRAAGTKIELIIYVRQTLN